MSPSNPPVFRVVISGIPSDFPKAHLNTLYLGSFASHLMEVNLKEGTVQLHYKMKENAHRAYDHHDKKWPMFGEKYDVYVLNEQGEKYYPPEFKRAAREWGNQKPIRMFKVCKRCE